MGQCVTLQEPTPNGETAKEPELIDEVPEIGTDSISTQNEPKEGQAANTPSNEGVPKQRAHQAIDTASIQNSDAIDIQQDALMVQQWLHDVVELPQYFDMLISNGYESLNLIQEIDTIQDLNDIGITVSNHQTKLLNQIVNLNAIYNPQAHPPIFEHNNQVQFASAVQQQQQSAERELSESESGNSDAIYVESVDDRVHEEDAVLTVKEHVTINYYDQQERERPVCMVFEWITSVVGLPEYYDRFMVNGYERLDVVREIEGVDDLLSIGIVNASHQNMILNSVFQLREHPETFESPVELHKHLTVE
eukprot:152181_1